MLVLIQVKSKHFNFKSKTFVSQSQQVEYESLNVGMGSTYVQFNDPP